MEVKKRNYQKELEKTIEDCQKEGKVPTVLLHSCCAPCSTYVIDYLSQYFNVTVYYYNPNIDEQEEYQKRAQEQKRLIECMPTPYLVKFVEGPYEVADYLANTSALALEKEGGKRCFICYEMRLQSTAQYAKAHDYDYFATTLTISPLKNAVKLNEIGMALQETYKVTYLPSDFKKKEGFKRSTELSKRYNLYRQAYCGCSYSKQGGKTLNETQGILVSNGYLRTKKFDEVNEMYEAAAKQLEIQLKIVYTNELIWGVEKKKGFVSERLQDAQFILFLDKDIRLAKHLENLGYRVFNSSEAIALCDDKSATMLALENTSIPMPKTIVAPLIYSHTYDAVRDELFIQQLEEVLGYPMIVKESFGSFGEQVYKVDTREALKAIRIRLNDKPHIYQAFIDTSTGRDVRINVVGEKVVASMLRTSKTDFRANMSKGGSGACFTPPDSFCKLAIEVCRHLKIDFAGVDLLFGEKEEPILCEVNSNAHIKNIWTCTGIDVAYSILEHIQQEIGK